MNLNVVFSETPRAPDPSAQDARIPVEQLPRCQVDGCDGLLRPHVVWFGESLDQTVLQAASQELDECDLCLVVIIMLKDLHKHSELSNPFQVTCFFV